MTQIYKIINSINSKIYVGKTSRTIQERWKEHLLDINKESVEKRPLYNAMRKYGTEFFSIKLIEEVDDSVASEREIYWIEHFQSFKYGYNATIGGDGRPYIDRDLVIATYQQLKSMKQTAKQLKISSDSVSYILKHADVETLSAPEVMAQKIIHMYNMNKEYIQTFSSYRQAANFLKTKNSSIRSSYVTISKRIKEVCKGERKSAYKYYWSF